RNPSASNGKDVPSLWLTFAPRLGPRQKELTLSIEPKPGSGERRTFTDVASMFQPVVHSTGTPGPSASEPTQAEPPRPDFGSPPRLPAAAALPLISEQNGPLIAVTERVPAPPRTAQAMP